MVALRTGWGRLMNWIRRTARIGLASADLHTRVGKELILRDGEIERRRSLPDAAGGVVHRAVARAEPALVFALVPDRHAAEMRAHAHHDQPVWLLDPLRIGLRVAQFAELNVLRILNFFLGPVTDEDRAAAPFDRDDLPLWYRPRCPPRSTTSPGWRSRGSSDR